jgi:hypothetical protein
VRVIPPAQEPAVLQALRGAMSEHGLYVFPGMDMTRQATEQEQADWMKRYEAGPAGIVVFNPRPSGSFGTWMGMELAGNMLAALMAAIVMLHVPSSLGLGRRAGLVALLGLLETFDVDLSQWNWYGLPPSYFLAQGVDHLVGWFLAGLVIARLTRD